MNQVVETALDSGGQIEDMTVSMMINSRELTPETLEKYREMVAYGVGIAPEKVFITYAEFLAKPETPIYADPGQIATPTTLFGLPISLSADVLLYGGAGLVLLILLLIVLLMVRRGRNKRAPAKPGAARGAAGQPGEADEEEELPPQQARDKRPIPGEIVLNETREQALKRQVKEFTSANPEIVAQLIRSWMKEENK